MNTEFDLARGERRGKGFALLETASHAAVDPLGTGPSDVWRVVRVADVSSPAVPRARRDRGRGRGSMIRTAAAKTPKWALAKTAGRALRAAVGRARNCTCGVREINRIAQREGGWEEKASGGWAPGRRSAARFVASMPFGIARSTREARAETPRRVAPDAPDRRVGARASPERRPVAIRIERNPARSRRAMRRGRSAPGTAVRARARSAPWGPCKPWRRRRCS